VTRPNSPLNPAAIRPRLETLGAALLNACGGIEFAYLFGSAARAELTSRSDIDIAIHLEDHVDPVWARLEAARAAAIHLGTDAVDLVVLNTAPLATAGRILTSREVILDRVPFRRHAYESATARMFYDFRLREQRLLSARFGRVDRNLVLRKLADIERYLGELVEYRSLDAPAYAADWKIQRIVERTLHLAIEACMDVADHLVADRRLPVPETAAATFAALAGAGLIDPELARALGRMVAFRNILVHDYARLDPAIVLRVVRTDIADLLRFRDAALAAI
jgi:uncharacterized protein YutE (UPF0331/DUF86 family)/predicted nucleotidyltransferase